MKKRILALLMCTSVMCSMVACGDASVEPSDGATSTESTESVESDESEMPIIDLAKYEFNYADYVTLADYSAIPVELSSDYEVIDADVEEYVVGWFEYYGPFYTEDSSKTVIEAGDIINVDYVGKLNGEAFDGGTASNQTIDTTNNCSVDGTYYIDGFTDGLIGANVGDEIDCNVAFPEDYSNETLAGQDVVFTFTVNSIQKEIAFEDIDDEFAQNYADTDSVDGMYTIVRESLQEEYAYYKSQEINAGIQQYLLDNCTVEIPEDYFADIVAAYRNMFIWTYCDGDESYLEEFLSTNYGCTVEEAESEWEELLMEITKLDFILGVIAQEMDIILNEETYDAELEHIVSYYELDSVDDLYAEYGYGDVAYGEKRMREIYVQSDALDELAKTAIITITETTDAVEE